MAYTRIGAFGGPYRIFSGRKFQPFGVSVLFHVLSTSLLSSLAFVVFASTNPITTTTSSRRYTSRSRRWRVWFFYLEWDEDGVASGIFLSFRFALDSLGIE